MGSGPPILGINQYVAFTRYILPLGSPRRSRCVHGVLLDATKADSTAEVTFIERQIDYMIYRAREQWPVSK